MKRNIFVTIIFFIVIGIYTMLVKGNPGNISDNVSLINSYNQATNVFETSQERARFLQIISLANHHSFTIDPYYSYAKPDLAWYNNHYYPAYPPGVSVIALPFYLLGEYFHLDQLLSFAIIPVFAILTTYIIFITGKRISLSTRAAIFSALTFAFASNALVYGTTLYAHAISAFFTAVSLYLYTYITSRKNNFFIFSILWLILGINIFVDYPNIIVLLPIFLFSIVKSLRIKQTDNLYRMTFPLAIIYSAFTFLVMIGLFIQFNLSHFNRAITFTNRYNIHPLEQLGIITPETKLTNQLFDTFKFSNRFSTDQIISGIYALTFSPDHGLFIYFPIFLFAFLGYLTLYRKNEQLANMLALVALANVLLYGSFDDPWGGWSFGPRYLITSLPVLSLLVGVAFDRLRNIFFKIVFTIIFLYSFFVALLGALTTKLIPPSVEAVGLQISDNYFHLLTYLQQNQTSSFVYKTFFSKTFSLSLFALILYSSVSIVVIILVWTPLQRRVYASLH